MDILKSHRSIRKYSWEEVSAELINDILESGIRASNTGNMQLYSVIVTRNREQKEILAPLHFNQPMVKEAPVLLTICMDFKRFSQWCFVNNTKTDFTNLLWLLNGTIDASILAQNICVAAEFHGLGICYLGTALYNAPEISRVLNLPEGVIPVTAITLGYPDSVPDLTDRLPLKAVVHYESYSQFSKHDILAIYREKEELESSRQFVEENGKDNLAQVYAEVRYKTSDSIFFSEKILAWLRSQGFTFE